MDEETANTADIPAPTDSSQSALYDDLCRFLKNGMESDQACTWAAEQGLRITEDQRDYLERDLEAFDTSMIPGVDDPQFAEKQEPVTVPAPEREAQSDAPKKVEKLHLSKQEQRNFILGVFIVLAVAIALVRFITA